MSFRKVWIYIIACVILFAIEYWLFWPISNKAVTGDDWSSIIIYKQNSGKNILDNIYQVWVNHSPYYTSQVVYIGISHELFGLNFKLYGVLNIFLKTLAAICIYQLTFFYFKNRMVAFLTILYFATFYASAGSLVYKVTGVDYLSIIFLCLFGLIYYKLILTKLNIVSIFAGALTLFLAILISPLRIYPIIVVLFITELYLLVKQKNILRSLVRILIVLPPILLLLSTPAQFARGAYFESNPLFLLKSITEGNLHLILSPIAGLGFLVLDESFLSVLGNISKSSQYLPNILPKPLIYFLIIAIITSFSLLRQRVKYIVLLFCIWLIMGYTSHFLNYFHLKIPENLRINNTGSTFEIVIYAKLIAQYFLTIVISSLLWWSINKRNYRWLLVCSLSIGFSLVFLYAYEFLLGAWDYITGMSRYLVYPLIGVSIFFASLFTQIWQSNPSKIGRTLSLVLIIVFYTAMLIITKQDLSKHQIGIEAGGNTLERQEYIQNEIIKQISLISANKQNLLIFFQKQKNQDVESYKNNQAANVNTFYDWYRVRTAKPNKLFNDKSCFFIFTDINMLAKLRTYDKGEVKYLAESDCGGSHHKVLFRQQEIIALEINSKGVVNITPQIIKQINNI